jgi:NAD(P)-dependent dehydrogenase (short-subunit alcohol dehydrogenase family)
LAREPRCSSLYACADEWFIATNWVGRGPYRLSFFVGLYGSTKFALEGLTESYRYELAPFGIDAVIVEPGTYPITISKNRIT